MKSLSLVLAICLFSSTGMAQEVDFEVPSEINIIQGRLSVTFKDNIKEQTADELIESLGYSIFQSTFESRLAMSTSEKALTQAEENALENDPRVLGIQQEPLPASVQSTNAQRSLPRFNITVSFQSHTSETEAKELLNRVTAIPFTFPQKRPNELVIDVGNEDEAAFAQLDGREEVKWVTYVGVAGNP